MNTLNTIPGKRSRNLRKRWYKFWMRRASFSKMGRFAMRLASLTAPPDIEAVRLAYINKTKRCGYISPKASIYHNDLKTGKNLFIGDGVILIQRKESGTITLGDNISVYKDCILDTGQSGNITVGSKSSIHHHSILKAYIGSIQIGSGVMIAANCALYSYNHEIAADISIRDQPIISRGGIKIADEAWLGTGVIVLDGADIGKGAVIGAGSVVNGHIPDNAIAVGNPAKVVKYRK